MTTFPIDAARTIIATALAKGAELKMKPLTIAVLDAGGHLVAFERQDGAPTVLRASIAIGKATAALAFHGGSRTLNRMAQDRPHFVAALSALSGGAAPVVPVPGGISVRNAAGEVIGAVCISGDTSDNDELAAVAGVEAAGFKAETGA